MAIDWKLQAAKWRRAFWAVVSDADAAKDILDAKKARRTAKSKKAAATPKKVKKPAAVKKTTVRRRKIKTVKPLELFDFKF